MSELKAYGGWRERRGFGVGTLTGRQTATGLIAVVLSLAVVLLVPGALPLLGAPAACVLAAMLIRIRGESLVAVAGRHTGWRVRRMRGGTAYRGSDEAALPGSLAGVDLRALADGTGVLLDPQRRTLTAVVEVEPQGVEFADEATLSGWVAGWGDWLAHLGYVPEVRHAAVTVFSRPVEPVGEQSDDMMREIALLAAPEHRSRTLISVTLTADVNTPADGGRLGEVLDSLRALQRCGMTVLDPLSCDHLIEWVRDCYEPYATASAQGAVWSDARPFVFEEDWDSLRHDGAWSAAFAWDECPGDAMGPQSLSRLLSPSWYATRVVVVFAPVPAHTAAREVDRQAEAAAFRSQYRRRLGRDETARERLDVARARQTAHDQARGSGLVDVGVYATASVREARDLPRACADLQDRAGQARLRLRRAYGEQADTFAATLGLGQVPRRRW